MRELLAAMDLEPLSAVGSIDSGAEEELFRRLGQRAASELMAARWEEADSGAVLQCESCEQSLKPLGRRKKRLQTVCGPTELKRRVYYCPCCQQTVAPLDQRLGVEQGGMTPGLMRLVCRSALELPYQQSQRLLSDTLGFVPCSAREIERVAKKHGQRIEQLRKEQVSASDRAKPQCRAVWCLALDGVMIPGLPDAQEHRLQWHDVKLGVGFDVRGVRKPFYIAGREHAESFGERLWGAVERRGLDQKSFCLMVGDGAPWIWNLAELHLPGVPQLLDFYHAAEHLYATAELVWGETKTKESWWHRRLAQLQEGRLSEFFAALQRLARAHQNLNSEHSPQRLLKYFADNEKRLNYAWAEQNNLPIGSGSVESAARHIVQQRLKQSGMRWSDEGAQSILNLRTLHRNGLFEQYWEDFAAAVGF